MHEILQALDAVREDGKSSGRIISGKYGEGKTHLLNTVFNIAHANNMVVSVISLSKETPFDKLYWSTKNWSTKPICQTPPTRL